MKSIRTIGKLPESRTLVADEIIEFHASRVLMLIYLCGKADRSKKKKIEGLTKLAKLDFFVRYPEFFRRAAAHLGHSVDVHEGATEPAMIRFHYGPWDKRYYRVLPYLEARGLITVTKNGSAYNFTLTDQGMAISSNLAASDSFNALTKRMDDVREVMSNKTGTQLKDLVYALFEEEVADKKLNEKI